MDIEKIRELVRLMVENGMSELDVTEGENKIRLKRGLSGEVAASTTPPQSVSYPMMMPMVAPAAPAGVPEAPHLEAGLLEIKSPMVGTFYSAGSPDSDPYVSVGTRVDNESVVCIIEAMKVMNEIKAELVGEIVEICVKNIQPVEYGQVLFRVRPA